MFFPSYISRTAIMYHHKRKHPTSSYQAAACISIASLGERETA